MSYDVVKKLRDIDGTGFPDLSCRIKLDANESFIDIKKEAPELADKIYDEIKSIPLNRYPDPNASELTVAIADYYNIPSKYITVGNGSDELIGLITGAMLNKGETIVTLSPDFSMYAFYATLDELNVYQLQKDESNAVNIPKIIDYCNNNNVKAVIFSNPCNPTSLGVSRNDIIKLVKNLFCLVIVDEAYMDFWDKNESALDLVSEYDNLIILKTMSKALSMAGIRVGFAAAGETVTNALKTAKTPYNVDSVSQIIAKNVLMEKRMLAGFTERIIESRKDLNEKLTELGASTGLFDKVYESVTNFIYLRSKYTKAIYDGLKKESILIKKVGVNYLRITTGSYEENEILMNVLNKIADEKAPKE